MTAWWKNLGARAWRRHSQTGEEGIIEAIIAGIDGGERAGEGSGVAVEFGAGPGVAGVGEGANTNTLFLRERGWRVVMFEANPLWCDGDLVRHETITEENVDSVFARHNVADPEIVSIDVDGQDWWIWHAMTCRPRLVVTEINGEFPLSVAKTIARDPGFVWAGDNYYGASLAAWVKLAEARGYRLVHQQLALNAFFVRTDLLPEGFSSAPALASFTPVRGHASDALGRPWVLV